MTPREPAADAATTLLRLELDAGLEPVTGRISDAAGTVLSFCGWLEFADALSRLAAPTAPGDPAGR